MHYVGTDHERAATKRGRPLLLSKGTTSFAQALIGSQTLLSRPPVYAFVCVPRPNERHPWVKAFCTLGYDYRCTSW